jgi:UDPglucose 6-dehydrogenase
MPIYEPGLDELVRINTRVGRLSFSSRLEEAIKVCEIIFIAVGTPTTEEGEADLSCVEDVARTIATHINSYRLIVEKSTVPVETGERVRKTISTYIRKKVVFDVASNPEFLREGQAINDFMHPDRIVIGVSSKKAQDMLLSLYAPLKAPILVTDIKSAELIKHASNAFLATKISFINAVSRICDKVGADIEQVAQGMGLDKRIGADFLNAGLGYGGSCFPKDLDAFVAIARKLGYDFSLLKEVKRVNEDQIESFLEKIKDALWVVKDKTIGVLGISFKPNTDDIRNAPSFAVIRALLDEGAKIKAYDPQAVSKAKPLLKGVRFCPDAYDVCKGAECVLIITEWDEFKDLDFKRVKKLLKRPLIIDGRNMYDPKVLKRLGFTYLTLGRS